MNTKQFYNILSVLLVAVLILALLCALAGATLLVVKLAVPAATPPPENVDEAPEDEKTPPEQNEPEDLPTNTDPEDMLLKESPDAGIEYQDSLIFFGESTTSHLVSRGVLSGGNATTQVWKDDSGTRMLSSQGLATPIVYPETGELLTIKQACNQKKPQYIVLSFGVNGITGFINNKSSYVNNYHKLINTIKEASPDTKIILQTVYPVRAATDYSVDTDTLNQYINTLNEWLFEIAAEHSNVRIADTASVLTDADGKLASHFDSGDGLHLTREAYQAILQYLRTHAWVAETD